VESDCQVHAGLRTLRPSPGPFRNPSR
jgi:hypothetical protein